GPPQAGQVAFGPRRSSPGANMARPAAVSRAGRSSATTDRLRSSPQIDATIGTGSSDARLTFRIETGPSRARAESTASTPRSPSARPTTVATSRTIRRESADRTGNRGHPCALDVEQLAERPRHVVAVHVAVREEVDVRKRVLGPRVD